MQTRNLRWGIARASKGLIVAVSVLVAATAIAQIRPLEKFIHVGIGPSPGGGSVCGLTDTHLLRCWGGFLPYPTIVSGLDTQSGAFLQHFWMGLNGVCSLMTDVSTGFTVPGCTGVLARSVPNTIYARQSVGEFGQSIINGPLYFFSGTGPHTRGRKLALGLGHQCVVYGATTEASSAGLVACAGFNYEGVVLGLPSAPPEPASTGTVAGLINIVDISISNGDLFWINGNPAGGGAHTCVVEGPGADQGKVKCWGRNRSGQLGNGQTAVSPAVGAASPVVATGISTAVAVSAGSLHTCALLADTTVSCWGANPDGRLGNNNGAVVNVPTVVAGLSGVTSVVSGFTHTCAIGASGNVFCWGDNDRGMLGNHGFTGASSSTPQQVTGVTGATTLAVGRYGACATLTNGSIRCWPEAVNFPDVVVPGDCNMDFDGNGSVSATSDGLIGLRALFGLTGTAVTNGALGAGARWSWPEVRAVMTLNCGIPGISR
jgi:hypothetical protein